MTLADDLLTGANAIAAYIGCNRRRVYHLAATGYLPIARVGNLLVARKSELERALSAMTEDLESPRRAPELPKYVPGH